MTAIPVITIDGPAASGKGTIARQLADELAFHFLDSGKIYRAAALAAQRQQIAADDQPALLALAERLAAQPAELADLQNDSQLGTPAIGQAASLLAASEPLRQRLIPLQRAARQPPGLVADGRDMATRIFPDATLKVFLTADLPTRARRRLEQLKKQGICAKITDICADLEQRDLRDTQRAAAPLKPAADALQIDSTAQSIGDITDTLLRAYRDAAVCL